MPVRSANAPGHSMIHAQGLPAAGFSGSTTHVSQPFSSKIVRSPPIQALLAVTRHFAAIFSAISLLAQAPSARPVATASIHVLFISSVLSQ